MVCFFAELTIFDFRLQIQNLPGPIRKKIKETLNTFLIKKVLKLIQNLPSKVPLKLEFTKETRNVSDN